MIKSIFVPVSGRNKGGVDGGKWGLAENTEIPAVIIKRKKKKQFSHALQSLVTELVHLYFMIFPIIKLCSTAVKLTVK